MNRPKKLNGFTLVELMVVVAIIGILAGIAYPSYQNNVQKSHRADAEAALIGIVNRLERQFTEQNTYEGVVEPDNEFYTISINATQTTYTISAIPITGKAQQNDSCGTLTINNFGEKSADATGCW